MEEDSQSNRCRHENLLSIAGFLVLAQRSPSEMGTRAASSTLLSKSEGWKQIVKDVMAEVQPYRDGVESYTFHLSIAIDDHLLKQAGK